jgi:hypothetical protein
MLYRPALPDIDIEGSKHDEREVQPTSGASPDGSRSALSALIRVPWSPAFKGHQLANDEPGNS